MRYVSFFSFHTPGGTRTRNPQLRRLVPYPLGHRSLLLTNYFQNFKSYITLKKAMFMGSTSSSNQIYSRWNANIISRYKRIRQMNSRWDVSQIPNIIQNNSEFVWTQLAGYEAALPERFFFISWPATWNLISSQTPWPPGHKCMKYSRIRLKLKHIWSTGRQFPPGTRGLLWLPFGALLLLIKLFFINATPTFCKVGKNQTHKIKLSNWI